MDSREAKPKYDPDWSLKARPKHLPYTPHPHWDECERCLRNLRVLHTGVPFYNPLGGIPSAHMVPLSETCTEYASIVNMFNADSDGLMRVLSVHRVQNDALYQQYHMTLNTMIMDSVGTFEERTHLCHSSSASLDELVVEGLDPRLSSVGLFGRGTYATPSPAKASSYWKGTSEVRTMFIVRMILGLVYVFSDGKFDHTLVREPRGYDSVKGNITGHDEYVVYKGDRVLIEYVVRYLDYTPPLAPVRVTVPPAPAVPSSTGND